MATDSSILSWKAPWPEEPGGLHCLPTRNKHHAGMDVFMFNAVFLKPGAVANT